MYNMYFLKTSVNIFGQGKKTHILNVFLLVLFWKISIHFLNKRDFRWHLLGLERPVHSCTACYCVYLHLQESGSTCGRGRKSSGVTRYVRGTNEHHGGSSVRVSRQHLYECVCVWRCREAEGGEDTKVGRDVPDRRVNCVTCVSPLSAKE